MKFTEEQLERFASPISQSESDKCKNAIRMVSDAMKLVGYTDNGKDIRTFETDTYSFALDLSANYGSRKIVLLVQGSFANKTNIPSQSDVDVAVILESTFIPKYRELVSDKDYGFSEGTYTARELKDEVEHALNVKFGYEGVERRDKSIKVFGNTYRVDADVVPAYRYRDYSNDFLLDCNNYVGGIEIRPDSGGQIINYPEQHIKMGIAKNKATDYKFKKCVRIIKNMREKMKENNIYVSDKISSFGLESLLWNVDVGAYRKYSSLKFVFDEIVDFLYNNTASFDSYVEVNGIKSLFVDQYTKESYVRFVKDLNDFYEYDI